MTSSQAMHWSTSWSCTATMCVLVSVQHAAQPTYAVPCTCVPVPLRLVPHLVHGRMWINTITSWIRTMAFRVSRNPESRDLVVLVVVTTSALALHTLRVLLRGLCVWCLCTAAHCYGSWCHAGIHCSPMVLLTILWIISWGPPNSSRPALLRSAGGESSGARHAVLWTDACAACGATGIATLADSMTTIAPTTCDPYHQLT